MLGELGRGSFGCVKMGIQKSDHRKVDLPFFFVSTVIADQCRSVSTVLIKLKEFMFVIYKVLIYALHLLNHRSPSNSEIKLDMKKMSSCKYSIFGAPNRTLKDVSTTV